MLSIQRLFVFLLCVNALGLLVLYSLNPGDAASLKPRQELYFRPEAGQKLNDQTFSLLVQAQGKLDELTQLIEQAQNELKSLNNAGGVAPRRPRTWKRVETQTQKPSPFKPLINNMTTPKFTPETNPFRVLGAYPKVSIEIPYSGGKHEKMRLHKVTYGIDNEDDYCERVDYYNLANPDNVFKLNMFFTDYGGLTVPKFLIPKIGHNLMRRFTKHGIYSQQTTREHHFDIRINSFYVTMDGFHYYHMIGKHFLCATQMFNHIPGQRALIRKDDLVNSVDLYAKTYSDRPKCFNKKMFFPFSYRLYLKEECEEFLDLMNSQEYKDSLKNEPIQYIIKVGHGSHSANGVFILDKNQTDFLNTEYNYGKMCGVNTEPLIAQKYVANPLLLDLDNKFDFRIYMLIASTNPLIVYYHDGFLRASLSTYNKTSTERGVHLTNTHLAEEQFKAARIQPVKGMNEQELREYHIWSFAELEEYLKESGKVSADENWLDTVLRPQFKKAMIHIVKMSSSFFWKQSNVYALYGLDFMLDDKFNLWFIEGNPNPQLIGTSPFLGELLDTLLRSLFDIEFGLYRSRMKRALGVVKKFMDVQKKGDLSDDTLDDWKKMYKEATLNRFEPEYEISKNNSFSLVMNEYEKGAKAYNYLLEENCLPKTKSHL